MIYIGFPMMALVFIIIFLCLYFSKKRINLFENKVVIVMMIINIVGLLLELGCYLVLAFWKIQDSFFGMFILKSYIVYIFVFTYLFAVYIFLLTDKKKDLPDYDVKKYFMKVFLCFLPIVIPMTLVTYIAPLHYYAVYPKFYTYGLATKLLFVNFVFLLPLLCIKCVSPMMHHNKVSAQVGVALFGVLLTMGAGSIVQFVDQSVLIITSVHSIMLTLIYFTIENPDLKMVQQLEIAKDAADRANNSKTEFLSSMSHEIRTPLNAIVGFSDCIMDASSIEEAKENAKDIVNASQTLLEIVNGILDISKIEAGKMEIVNVKYNPMEVFTELATLITPRMKEKGLDFSFSIDPTLPATLFGDKANLKKIVTNFLSNACKYTDHGFVRYEVHCVNLGDYCRLIISVEDSGRGIKKDSVDKLFTRFQRLDEDRNTTIEGTGLGLAITKQLTELMGGKVLVHTVYGEGSKFTAVINQKIDSLVGTELPKQYTHLDLSGVRILVVDDAQLNLKVTDKLFRKYGADSIDLCSSGFECLEKIKNGDEYDLLFLDDMMPRMNGIETFHKLKENPNFHIPTIALTANAITGMREKYIAEGFNDYLAKPIEQNELIRVCNDLLGRNTGYTGKIEIPKDQLEEKNSDVIPVEDNIEEIIENKVVSEPKVDASATPANQDEVKVSEYKPNLAPPTSAPVVNLIPVVDIRFGSDAPKEKEEPASEVLEEVTPLEEAPEKVEENISEVLEENSSIDEASENEVYDRSYLEKNGADINHALELLGDMEMYNATIQDFLSEVEEKWQRLENYRDSGDMKNYAIDVHSLKSDCKYLGFMSLADIAYQHELKSKDNDLDYVREHFPELEEEYKKTLEIAKNYSSHNPAEE